jgi:hypothetical protein
MYIYIYMYVYIYICNIHIYIYTQYIYIFKIWQGNVVILCRYFEWFQVLVDAPLTRWSLQVIRFVRSDHRPR